MSQTITSLLRAAGFTVTDTGGHCTAWYLELPEDRYILITDCGGASHRIADGEPVVVGLYSNNEGEPIATAMHADITGIADAHLLAILKAEAGALLCWKTSRADSVAFGDALQRGVIRFDSKTDCYVHPDALKLRDGGYIMREAS